MKKYFLHKLIISNILNTLNIKNSVIKICLKHDNYELINIYELFQFLINLEFLFLKFPKLKHYYLKHYNKKKNIIEWTLIISLSKMETKKFLNTIIKDNNFIYSEKLKLKLQNYFKLKNLKKKKSKQQNIIISIKNYNKYNTLLLQNPKIFLDKIHTYEFKINYK